ncbi:MAG: hypothetical protein K6D96_06900 [Acetatifactor sp.]|nr:hypothetical protein [Acetatifactor sp.]
MDYDKKCTILVNTCDAYSDVWDLFFTSLKKQWPNCPYSIVMNTQTKDYSFEGLNIRIVKNKSGKKDCWGKRLRKSLKQIDTPYVIPILEDFILFEPITNADIIVKAMKWMEDNKKIAAFYLHQHPFVGKASKKYDGFGIMPLKCEYRLTTAVGIWRTDKLMKYTRDFETPWEFEVNGSVRIRKYHDEIYALTKDGAKYEVWHTIFGGVIWRSKWHPKAIEIASKYGVDIDFSIRGIMDEDNPYQLVPEFGLRQGFPFNMLKPIFWRTLYTKIRKKIRFIRSMI